MAAVATCEHGLDAGTCLICATLAKGPVVPAASTKPARRDAKPARRERSAGPDRPGRHIGVLGGLVVAVAVLVVAWFLYRLVWSALHLVELALVGVVCGYVGYRVGVIAGRHRR